MSFEQRMVQAIYSQFDPHCQIEISDSDPQYYIIYTSHQVLGDEVAGKLLKQLVQAKIDSMTAVFSDDPDAPGRDTAYYWSLLVSQKSYSDAFISQLASMSLNGSLKIEDGND